MDLDEFCWRKRVTLKEISRKTGIHANTLSDIKNLKIIPRLDTALRLYIFTKGEVGYMDMISKNSSNEIKKWIGEVGYMDIISKKSSN